MAQRNFIENKN